METDQITFKPFEVSQKVQSLISLAKHIDEMIDSYSIPSRFFIPSFDKTDSNKKLLEQV